MPASLAEAYGGLLLLAAASIPTGLSVLGGLEWLLRHRFGLTPVERTVLALYTTGTLLFLLASIPAPIYGAPLLATVLLAGTLVYGYLLTRRRAAGLRAIVTVARQPAMVLVVAGFLGLLLFELVPVWSHPFPNAWDGSVTSLWTNLILKQSTIPSSLQPFASAPAVYPMGTSVWMTLPVLILGWSIVQSPVLLPPLFLSLTVPAAYAWGARWSRSVPAVQTPVALLFAAFFGLVASVPRLYTGGWYDFALALPLLIVAIGVLPEWGGGARPSWKGVTGLGLLSGALTSLSLAAGEAVVVLALAYVLVQNFGAWRGLATRVAQVGALVLFELVFASRSIIAWLGSPGAAYAPTDYYGALDSRLVMGEIDPFVPWKGKLSPFPAAALELQILLAVGFIGAAVVLLWLEPKPARSVTGTMASQILTGTVAALVMTSVLLVTALPNGWAAALGRITNLGQASTLLFLFFTGVALLPLVWAVTALWSNHQRSDAGDPHQPPKPTSSETIQRGRTARGGISRTRGIALAMIVVIPLTVGAVTTVVQGPGYLQSNVDKTSSVTPGDVTALLWAGSNLPSCSVVLIAPGSAAQFLPEYAAVHVDFPMNPVPTNSSYNIAVANLTQDVYSSETRTALVTLGITEVFVTGATSVSYPPFSAQPLASSSNFSLVFNSGDAEIFAFLPVTASTHCSG